MDNFIRFGCTVIGFLLGIGTASLLIAGEVAQLRDMISALLENPDDEKVRALAWMLVHQEEENHG